jgi:nucleoside-diphosphate-sugar epimerase
VSEALHGIDAVVHLGGLVGDQACELDPELTIAVNLTGTQETAVAARDAGVSRFVFASTCSVYGSSKELLSEGSPLDPLTTYARTKARSEAILAEMASGAFSTVSLRYGTLYGLAPRLRFDLMVNLLTARAVKEGGFTVYGGSQWRPFVHVDDAAEATVMALDAPASVVSGEVFNVGSDEQNHPIAEVGALIERLIPEAEVIYDLDRVGDADYCVSFAKIKSALGFAPRRSLLDGINEIRLALEQGTIDDYRDNRYSNEAALTESAEVLRHPVESEVIEGG